MRTVGPAWLWPPDRGQRRDELVEGPERGKHRNLRYWSALSPGMTIFDETMIPDKDASAIAEYVLKTFQ